MLFVEKNFVSHPKYGEFTLWIPWFLGSSQRSEVLTAAGELSLEHPGEELVAVASDPEVEAEWLRQGAEGDSPVEYVVKLRSDIMAAQQQHALHVLAAFLLEYGVSLEVRKDDEVVFGLHSGDLFVVHVGSVVHFPPKP